MKTLKNPYSTEFINHFTPFHKTLTEMSNSADEREYQGGMVWDFKYLQGSGHTAKLDDIYVSHRPDFNNPPSLKNQIPMLAKLIWLTLGHPFDGVLQTEGLYMSVQEFEVKRNEIISNYYNKAAQMIKVFETSGCDKSFLSFQEDDGLYMSFASVALKGRNAIIHSAFWSVD